AAEGLDPVLQPAEPGRLLRAALDARAADAVVADDEGERLGRLDGAEPDARRPCVLHGVRDRLRGDVVRSGLDRRREPTRDAHVELDGDGRARYARAQRRFEALAREERRVEAARDLS